MYSQRSSVSRFIFRRLMVTEVYRINWREVSVQAGHPLK